MIDLTEKAPGPPIFIGGAGRSGTTLLRVMLDSHPEIACGPELKVLPRISELWNELRQPLAPILGRYHVEPPDIDEAFSILVNRLLESYRVRSGKSRIAEKTPDNVFCFAALAKLFPRSPLVQVIRDGRDVVASLLKMKWIHPATGERDPRTTCPENAARYWVEAIRTGRKTARLSPRYVEVRYEDLVLEPEPTLMRLFAHLGVPYDPAVLEYHRRERDLTGESSAEQVQRPLDPSAVGRWRTALDAPALETVQRIAGPTLAELGYAS